jgi:protein-S-isoprenylcysteine O-methyltransferase Ste14
MTRLPFKDYFYVGAQSILFALFIGFQLWPLGIIPGFNLPEPLPAIGLGIVGLGSLCIAIALLQLNERLSPFPTPKANARLLQNGLFALVRHPIYTGLILAFGGWSIRNQSLEQMAITLLLWVLFSFKARYEEKRLLQRFPDYAEYRKKTGRFWPKWGK